MSHFCGACGEYDGVLGHLCGPTVNELGGPESSATGGPASWRNDHDVCRMCGKWDVFMDPHHIVTAQQIRKSLSHLPDNELAEVLGDERNLMWLCRDCHERHHNRSRPVPAGCLNSGHWEFANLWDLDWYLEKMYADNQEDAK